MPAAIAIPLAMSAVQAGAGALAAHKANKANKDRLNQENTNAAADEANRNNIINQLKAHGTDIYGPQTSTRSDTGGSSSHTSSDTSFRNNPFITGDYKPMEAKLRSLIEGRLGQANTVTEAEKAAQLRNINAASAGALASIRNMGGRGFSSAQLAAAGTPIQMARAGQIGNYMATLPDLERARREKDLAMASGAISGFGTGQEGTSHTNSNTNSTSFGNSTSTGGPDISAILGLTTPNGRVSTNTGASPIAGLVGDLAGAAGTAYAGYNAAKNAAKKPASPAPIDFGNLRGEGGLF